MEKLLQQAMKQLGKEQNGDFMKEQAIEQKKKKKKMPQHTAFFSFVSLVIHGTDNCFQYGFQIRKLPGVLHLHHRRKCFEHP